MVKYWPVELTFWVQFPIFTLKIITTITIDKDRKNKNIKDNQKKNNLF